MRFEEFERRAWRLWQEIPQEYREGVDGLVVERDALPHPTLPEIYTLGECMTEAYPSDYGGPDSIRSVVVLYHGSFWRLSRLDPAFDWDNELWETLTHELRHHLESLAAEDTLEGVDYAADENFKRLRGEPFDPFFYRSGDEVAPGVFHVERDFFIEREYVPTETAGGGGTGTQAWLELEWHGARYRLRPPAAAAGDTGDVCFVRIRGVDAGPGELYAVLVRRRRMRELVRGLLRPDALDVRQLEAAAERRA